MYAAPRIGFRYVDDDLRTSRESPDTFLQKCNQLHPNLEFTIELLDQERAIVILDMKIRRKNNGLLVTEWYRKPSDRDDIVLDTLEKRRGRYSNSVGNAHRDKEKRKTTLLFSTGGGLLINLFKNSENSYQYSRFLQRTN